MSQQIVKGVTVDNSRYIRVHDVIGFLRNEQRELQKTLDDRSDEVVDPVYVRLSGKISQLEIVIQYLVQLST